MLMAWGTGKMRTVCIDTFIAGAGHSRVFGSLEELEAAGYDDASKDDKVAFLSESGKVGLVYHGVKSKAWSTAG